MIKSLALAALSVLFLTAAPAFAQDAPAPPVAPSGYDLSLLHPDVRAAVEQARAGEAQANRAAERARSAARNGEHARGNTVTNGNGFVELPGHDTYAGGVAEGAFDGFGVYTFREGATLKYEGEFDEGAMSGAGIYSWREGARFAGTRDDGGRSGPGVHYLADGRRYEGGWSGDKRNGAGVEWAADGRVRLAGVWTNNQLTTPLAP
jgi:hypothetical protein